MVEQIELSDWGFEYARLVLIQEYGITPSGEKVERHYTPSRQKEIETAFRAAGNFTLQTYVETALDALDL